MCGATFILNVRMQTLKLCGIAIFQIRRLLVAEYHLNHYDFGAVVQRLYSQTIITKHEDCSAVLLREFEFVIVLSIETLFTKPFFVQGILF